MKLATLTMFVAITLLALMLAVADIKPPVSKLPPVTLAADVILPDADSNPVTYSPVVANTATLAVPPTPTLILPLAAVTVTLLLPELMLATVVMIPVRLAPLPRIKLPVILP